MRISLIKKVSKLHHMNELYPLHFWQKISNTSFHYKPRIFFFCDLDFIDLFGNFSWYSRLFWHEKLENLWWYSWNSKIKKLKPEVFGSRTIGGIHETLFAAAQRVLGWYSWNQTKKKWNSVVGFRDGGPLIRPRPPPRNPTPEFQFIFLSGFMNTTQGFQFFAPKNIREYP